MKAKDSSTEPDASSHSRVLPLQKKGLFYQHVDQKLTLVHKCMPHIGKFQHSLPQYRHQFSAFRKNLISHLVPTAHCLSNSSNSETDVQSMKEDENVLPGFRIKRERKSVQVSSQKIEDAEINMWLSRETGIERLKRAYAVSPSGFLTKSIFVQEDTQTLGKIVYYGVIAGSVLELVLISSQKKGLEGTREKYLSASQTLIKSGQIPKMPQINIRGCLKHMAFCGLAVSCLTHLPHMIAVYRNETTMLELVGGAFTMWSIVSFKQEGTKNILKNMAGGVGFGVLYAFWVMSKLKSMGQTQQERNFIEIKRAILETRLSNKEENQLLSLEESKDQLI